MIFKSERERDAEKFKSGNEKYYLKVNIFRKLLLFKNIVQMKDYKYF